MRPVIAMPQTGRDEFREYMKSKYTESLARAGADWVWIELDDVGTCIEKMLTCDGLLLPGGGDIEPTLYGQERHPKCEEPHPIRDEFEWKMLEAFLPTGKPILCICRGIQMLNVVLGGTLHQHIENHSCFDDRAEGSHNISIVPGTRLAQMLPQETIWANSMHHQCADRIGENLMLAATAEDGTIEALEHKDHPFCIGVQWHPEHMSETREDQQKIFDVFVQQCKAE